MSTNYIVRTYKRSNTILDQTLKCLREQNDIDLGNKLYIVVANNEELQLYKTVLVDYPVKDFIVADVGIDKATNAITTYFPEGEPIVVLDDDIYHMKCFTDISTSKSLETMHNFGSVVEYTFDKINKINPRSIFSQTPTTNWMFKRNKPFLEYKAGPLVGGIYGGYNDKTLMYCPQGHDEDNIRTAAYLDAGIPNFMLNHLVFNKGFLTNSGGMQASGERGKSPAELKDKCSKLMDYPGMVKFYNPPAELRPGYWGCTIKNKRELDKLIQYKHHTWSTYMQPLEDGEGSLLE